MKNILKKIFKPFVFSYLKKRGVVSFRRKRLLDELFEDLFEYKGASLKEKFWYYRHDYTSEKKSRYGLTKENYKDFISDIDFYREVNYVNRRFTRMFDDKLVFYHFFREFRRYMPKHYYLVHNNKLKSIENYNSGTVLKLLKNGKELAAKPCFGRHGEGFYRIRAIDKKYVLVNNNRIALSKIDAYLQKLENYIITDYVGNHPQLESAAPHSSMVFRLVTIYDEELGPGILGVCARFQKTAESMVVDQPDGVHCGVDLDTGSFFRPMEIGFGEFVKESHDLQQYGLPERVPYFDEMKSISLDIAKTIHITPYLTFDYIISPTGPKMLEIGSHGMPRSIQQFYPYRKDSRASKLFNYTT